MPTRLIREGLLDSERVCGLPLEARWLFVTVCLQADDVGLFDAAPFALMRKAELQRDLGTHLLGVLADVDLIRLYLAAGKQYGFIPRYGQRLQMRRIKHPLPPLELVQGDDEAARKIKDLASRFPRVAATSRKFPPEAEAEKSKSSTESNSESRGGVPAAKPPADEGKKKRAVRKAPAEFMVDGVLQRWAREEAPLVDIREETEIFRSHEFAKARIDWPDTWKNWMRKEQKRLAEQARRDARPGAGQSFRARDGDKIASSLSKLTGGLLGRRPPAQGTIIEMEPDNGIGGD